MRIKHFWIFICLFFSAVILIGGCLQQRQSNPETKATEIKQTIAAISTQYTSMPSDFSPSMVATLEPSFTMRPSLTATATKEACLATKGQIELREIVIPDSSHPFAFRVYLPPCYQIDPDYDYPVLYLLHGQSFKDDQWDRLGVDDLADRLISSGDAPPFIIVMPFEGDYLADTHTSPFGQRIIDDLIPWVDQTFDTCDVRECRAIGGISRGAGWALHLGLIHWNLFGSIGTHSLALFSGDFYNAPYWFREIPVAEYPRIYMDTGTLDYMIESSKRFEERLTKYHVSHEWIINNGAHNEEYWSVHVEDYLRWYTFAWRDLPALKESIPATPNFVPITTTPAPTKEN